MRYWNRKGFAPNARLNDVKRYKKNYLQPFPTHSRNSYFSYICGLVDCC